MGSSWPQPEPELEGLLREIALDPRSSLFKIDRPTAIRGLFNREQAASRMMTGLTAAERHLLQVKRSEAALLLREACTALILAQPGAELTLRVEASRDGGQDSWDDRLRQSRALIWDDPQGPELMWSLTCGQHSNLSVADLALASLRLEATDHARLYVALDLIKRHQVDSGVRVLKNILGGSPSPLYASYCFEHLGMAHSDAGNKTAAQRFYKKAWQLQEQRSLPLLAWFAHSLGLADAESAIKAASILDGTRYHQDSEVNWYVNAQESTRQEASWKPSPAASTLAKRFKDGVGGVSRRLASVFT